MCGDLKKSSSGQRFLFPGSVGDTVEGSQQIPLLVWLLNHENSLVGFFHEKGRPLGLACLGGGD